MTQNHTKKGYKMITINSTIVETKNRLIDANDAKKTVEKAYQTVRETFASQIIADYIDVRTNDMDAKTLTNKAYNKAYFEILHDALLLDDKLDIAIINLIATLQKALQKLIFNFNCAKISTILKLMDNWDFIKNPDKIKDIKDSIKEPKAYNKALNKVLKKALSRRDAYTLYSADFTASLKKMSYIKLLEVAKIAKILATHKQKVYKKA